VKGRGSKVGTARHSRPAVVVGELLYFTFAKTLHDRALKLSGSDQNDIWRLIVNVAQSLIGA
jgi:hypothetical protein